MRSSFPQSGGKSASDIHDREASEENRVAAASFPRWKAQAPLGIHRSDWLQAGTRLFSATILSVSILVAVSFLT